MENDVALGQSVVRKGERDREQDELDTLKHLKEPSIDTMRGDSERTMWRIASSYVANDRIRRKVTRWKDRVTEGVIINNLIQLVIHVDLITPQIGPIY